MQVRVFFQLTSTHNLKREPIKVMDFEQSCPDMPYSLTVSQTHMHTHTTNTGPVFSFIWEIQHLRPWAPAGHDPSLSFTRSVSLTQTPVVHCRFHFTFCDDHPIYILPLSLRHHYHGNLSPQRQKKTRLIYFHHKYTPHTFTQCFTYGTSLEGV